MIDEKRESLRRSVEEHTREIRQRQQQKRLERQKGGAEKRSQVKGRKALAQKPSKKPLQKGKSLGQGKRRQE